MVKHTTIKIILFYVAKLVLLHKEKTKPQTKVFACGIRLCMVKQEIVIVVLIDFSSAFY
jgi:hypothetical protein